MLKLIEIILKVIATGISMIIMLVNLIICVIMWDGKFMVAHNIFEMLWDEPKKPV